MVSLMTHLHLASRADPSRRSDLPIRLVLADDHAAFRRSLRLLLDVETDLEVVAEASEMSSVMRHVHGQLPHVLVLDMRLPNGSGIEAIRRLRAQAPGTEIVVMTMEESPLFAQQAIDAGAIGFVVKDKADSELMTAIRNAARGQEYVSARVAAGLDACNSHRGAPCTALIRARAPEDVGDVTRLACCVGPPTDGARRRPTR